MKAPATARCVIFRRAKLARRVSGAADVEIPVRLATSFRSFQTRRYSAAQSDHFTRINEANHAKSTGSKDAHQILNGVLEEDTNLILHKIPVGKMTPKHRSLAHRVMAAWQRKRTGEGAMMAECLLERLVEEEEAGNHRVAYVTASAYNIAIDSWAKSGTEDCAQRAESILNRMEDRHRRHREREYEGTRTSAYMPARPDTISYNTTLHALSQSPDRDSPARVEELLGKMEELSSDPGSNVRPNTTSYNCLINAYANKRGEYGTGQKAEDVLLRMSEMNMNSNAGVNPDTHSFNIVLKAWLNSGEGGLESAKRAEQLLRLMVKLRNDGHDYVRPDAISFSTCMQAYAKVEHGGDELVERVKGLLTLLEETGAAGEDVTRCYDMAIAAIGQSGTMGTVEVVERISERMTYLYESGTLNVRPSSMTRAQIIYAIIKGASDRTRTAEDLFNEMIKKAKTHSSDEGGAGGGGYLTSGPDAASFRALMKTILDSNQDGAVKRVDNLLIVLEQASQEYPSLAPDTATYIMIIDAYSTSKEKGAAENAFKLLRRMEDSFATGNRKAMPVSFVYNSVIGQLKRCGEEGAEARAYEALMMMETQSKQGNSKVVPDTITFNVVIGMYAKLGTKNGAERALFLLRQMKSMAKEGSKDVQPDCVSFVSVIHAFTKIGDKRAAKVALELYEMAKNSSVEENRLIFIDDAVYKSVLGALKKSGELKFARKAYDILMEMKSLYNEGNAEAKIDSVCVNMVVGAYATAGIGKEGAAAAQAVLVDLISQYRSGSIPAMPDKVGFHSVIHAWAKAFDASAMKHVENLLQLMSQLQRQGHANLEPDIRTITLLIQVLSRDSKNENSLRRAQELFDELNEESHSDASKAPDKVLYDQMLIIWAKSNDPEKHLKTSAILQTMQDRYKQGSLKVWPDLISHNIVLNSCAYATGEEVKKEALQIAKDTFEQIQRSAHMEADAVTYGTMIKAIYNLCEDVDEQDTLVENILSQCKTDGQVGKAVVNSLPAAQRWQLLGLQEADGLPHQWTRNVKKDQL